MASLVEHHEHYDSARPQVHTLCVGGLVEYFGRHVEEGAALSLDVGRVVDLQFGGESEVDDFDGGEVVLALEEYVFYLIMEILAWLEVTVDDIEPMQVPDALQQTPKKQSDLALTET